LLWRSLLTKCPGCNLRCAGVENAYAAVALGYTRRIRKRAMIEALNAKRPDRLPDVGALDLFPLCYVPRICLHAVGRIFRVFGDLSEAARQTRSADE
jgi:hypothetical protein